MKLDSYLTKNGITQEGFAVMIGVAQASVNRWVKSSRVPRPEFMRRIAEVTNSEVTANDFVGSA